MAQSTFSMTQHQRTEPFELQVGRGQVPYHTELTLVGFQPSVAQTFIPLWENATTYTYPNSALIMGITGTDADTAQIQINGLDSNYVAISETVTLNGANTVNTTQAYFRVNSLVTISGNAANTVTCANAGVTYAKINPGIGVSQALIYTVPLGYTFYEFKVRVFSNLGGSVNNYCLYRNYTKDSNGVVKILRQSPFVTNYLIERQYPQIFTEKTDIQFQFNANSSTAIIGGQIGGVLVKNDLP